MEIKKISGTIELVSGLHIGGGDDTMKIGGIDNQVIKLTNSGEPYIPGSSLKGKMRSLLEWHFGLVNLKRPEGSEGDPFNASFIWKRDKETKKLIKNEFIDPAFNDKKLLENASNLLKLFGDKEGEFGITRISVGDCYITEDSKNLKLSEAKYENVIDRCSGTAKHPRQTERVPAGVKFNFEIRYKVLKGDDEKKFEEIIKQGLKLVEDDYLGGNGSRGYGRVKFNY